jgi:hypothetical protein
MCGVSRTIAIYSWGPRERHAFGGCDFKHSVLNIGVKTHGLPAVYVTRDD